MTEGGGVWGGCQQKRKVEIISLKQTEEDEQKATWLRNKKRKREQMRRSLRWKICLKGKICCVHTCASSISNYSHSVILFGISGTFSLHHVWQRGNTSVLHLFTLLSRPLISADSQSAPTQRAQVNIKRACDNLQVMWVQGRVWFPLGKEKK